MPKMEGLDIRQHPDHYFQNRPLAAYSLLLLTVSSTILLNIRIFTNLFLQAPS